MIKYKHFVPGLTYSVLTDGAEFEQYYVKNFDMYDYEISAGEFKRSKRNITESDDGTEEFVDVVVDVARQIAQNCHLHDVLLYGECLVSKFEDILDAFLITHPSLKYYNQTVNDRFVEQHYSSCRYVSDFEHRKMILACTECEIEIYDRYMISFQRYHITNMFFSL